MPRGNIQQIYTSTEDFRLPRVRVTTIAIRVMPVWVTTIAICVMPSLMDVFVYNYGERIRCRSTLLLLRRLRRTPFLDTTNHVQGLFLYFQPRHKL